jgi:hypothetical protein
MTHAERVASQVSAIIAENGDDRFFTNKEIKALPEVLSPDETLLSFCSGMYEGNTWLLSLTDRRIVFLDKGMLWGMKQTSVDLTKINSITLDKGLFFAKIRINDGGTGYLIDMVAKGISSIFVSKVEQALAALRSGRPVVPPGAAPDMRSISPARSEPSSPPFSEDRLARIERLVTLRESGALTEAEFQAEKARIISG